MVESSGGGEGSVLSEKIKANWLQPTSGLHAHCIAECDSLVWPLLQACSCLQQDPFTIALPMYSHTGARLTVRKMTNNMVA